MLLLGDYNAGILKVNKDNATTNFITNRL